MAAGVHLAVDRRLIGQIVGFQDRQRVHIGADADGKPGSGPFQDSHHAAPAIVFAVWNPDAVQLPFDNRRCPGQIESQFRNLVQFAPDGDDVLRVDCEWMLRHNPYRPYLY